MEKANYLGSVKTAEHVSAISWSWVALQIGKVGIDTEVENVLTGCTNVVARCEEEITFRRAVWVSW